MKKKEMEKYKEMLLDKKEKLLKDIRHLEEANLNTSQRDSSGDLSGYSLHMADMGTDNYDREFALGLVSSEQKILYQIDEALGRIEKRTYGKCRDCDCTIKPQRLKAMPFATHCIKCQELEEKKSGK